MLVKIVYIIAGFGMFLSTLLAKEFVSYWNIPTFACSQRFNLPVLNVTERYGIIQNSEDDFRGDQISILYHPGWFPVIFENGSYQNGGVPQLGDLRTHLEIFEQDVEKQIPDVENGGLAIIDFELWRPVYRQNFGKLQRYKEVSNKLVSEANPHFSKTEVENEANLIFTEYAKLFMIETLELAKKLRPKAKWGYYGLPHCFNGQLNTPEDCEKNIQDENDSTQWLYDIVDVIFPSIYMTETISPRNRPLMVKGRVREAIRLALKVNRTTTPLVIAYHRYKFPDTLNYLNESDNVNAVEAAKDAGADGIILWGAWKDVNTVDKCAEFYEYVINILGPSFQKSVTSHSSEEPINETSEHEDPSIDATTTSTDISETTTDTPETTINDSATTIDDSDTTIDASDPTVTASANSLFTGKMYLFKLCILIEIIIRINS